MQFTSDHKPDGFDFAPKFIRNLDMDDIFILACLYENIFTRKIVAELRIDYSSVSRRINRMKCYLGDKYFTYDFSGIKHGSGRNALSAEGRVLGKICRDFLESIGEFDLP